jgi:hypothetical protein
MGIVQKTNEATSPQVYFGYQVILKKREKVAWYMGYMPKTNQATSLHM